MTPLSDEEDVRLALETLRREIRSHEYRYYVENRPSITDADFDRLLKRLEELETRYPNLITEDSPTQRVGGAPVEGFQTFHHKIPLLSLQNVYSLPELQEFYNRIAKNTTSPPLFVGELKIDGLSISLHYRDGTLQRAVTRGDGEKGDDVTSNIRTIRSLPLHIPEGGSVEARGEVYLPRDSFETMNRLREERGEEPFANPRNGAAGTVHLLDPREVSNRHLEIFLYSLFFDGAEPRPSHRENLSLLRELGFRTNPLSRSLSSFQEMTEFIEETGRLRDSLDYDVDGIVFKVDDIAAQKALSSTSKFPRWAVAYKFPPEEGISRILSIQLQVGRTGAVTPVANLEPLRLAGSTVSRATLHNAEEIRRKDIRVGDWVWVVKSGDVIPKVTAVVKERREGNETPFTMPDLCPICASPLEKPEGEVVWRCPNLSCPARLRESLLHFVSRDAMNIDGFGEALVDQLLEKGMVKDPADLYTLRLDELETLERMGRKSGAKILNALQESKKNPLARLINGLGIRLVGEVTARDLAMRFPTLEALSSATQEELLTVPEVGEKVAQSLRSFFSDPSNLTLLEKLAEVGVSPSPPEPSQQLSLPWKGMKFVFTGELPSLERREAEAMVRSLGGEATGSVSGKTSFVVAGEAAGSKLAKALSLKVPVLSQEEFLRLFQEAGGSWEQG